MKLHPTATYSLTIKKFNTLEERFRKVHGDAFDYEDVVYSGARDKVKIRCKIHNSLFEMTPNLHLNGSGCPICGRIKTNKTNEERAAKSSEEFQIKSEMIHGKGTFSYHAVKYKNNKSKVKLWCNTHNKFFMQIPNAHIDSAQGCPDCGIQTRTDKSRMTQEEFIKSGKETHGDKYDYRETIYVSSAYQVKIWCNIHKEFFWQIPASHIRGMGCQKCGWLKASDARKKSTNEWILQAQEVHGDIYNYGEVNYQGGKEKVKIWCKRHEEFFHQGAGDHLSGQGCPKGRYDRSSEKLMMTTEEFIKRAIQTHGDKYSYHESKYKGKHERVKIWCNTHEKFFWQFAGNHYNGNDCPDCAVGGFKKDKEAILYYLKVEGGAYKIGITNLSVKQRYPMEMNNIRVIKTWRFANGGDAYNEEQRILKEFKSAKWTGSDLLIKGNTELFEYDVLQLDY